MVYRYDNNGGDDNGGGNDNVGDDDYSGDDDGDGDHKVQSTFKRLVVFDHNS